MDQKTEGLPRQGASIAVRRRVNLVATLTAGACMAVLSVPLARAQPPGRWKCQIDLHQGQSGGLELTLNGANLTGSLMAARGADSATTTTITGTWTTDVIQFTRVLSPGSVEPFVGVAVKTGHATARMAGRFASGFEGVWSATCLAAGDAPDSGDAPPGPSLSIRIDPFRPTDRDRVKFIANARHSSGVQDVTIYVNGQAEQTCPTEHCEFVGGPYPAGSIRWRVSARARNGGINQGRDSEVAIVPGSVAGSCAVSGAATGPRANVAKVFGIALFGPDDDARLRERQPLGSGRFSFANLPDGRYLLVAGTSADVSVHVNPPRRVVTCRGEAIGGIDFDFR
jgi:hypothetical protein